MRFDAYSFEDLEGICNKVCKDLETYKMSKRPKCVWTSLQQHVRMTGHDPEFMPKDAFDDLLCVQPYTDDDMYLLKFDMELYDIDITTNTLDPLDIFYVFAGPELGDIELTSWFQTVANMIPLPQPPQPSPQPSRMQSRAQTPSPKTFAQSTQTKHLFRAAAAAALKSFDV